MRTTFCTVIALITFVVFTSSAYSGHQDPPWDHQINGPARFRVLSDFNGEAVLDRETGLVWEQSPSTTTRTWFAAHSHCNVETVGNRRGWRLPTIQELASLVDPSQSEPALPSRHPFSNVQPSFTWSATTNASNTNNAWFVQFVNGGLGNAAKTFTFFVWCVRGGQGVDPQ
jgi:hypothetical protein